MLLYEVPNIIKIFYEEDNELIIHEWLEYNPENQDSTVLKILQKIYDIHLAYPVEKVIVKTDLTKGIFSPEMQEYIRVVQFPRLMADTKMKYVVTIKSNNAMKKMGATLWQKQLNEEADVILYDVVSEVDGREWLQTIA